MLGVGVGVEQASFPGQVSQQHSQSSVPQFKKLPTPSPPVRVWHPVHLQVLVGVGDGVGVGVKQSGSVSHSRQQHGHSSV